MLKRKSKKPNIFWHTFNLSSWHTPRLWINWGRVHDKRDSDMYPKGRFKYDVVWYYFEIGSDLVHKNILSITFTSNQEQYLKYLHQEWNMTKELIQGALLK